MNRRYFIYPLVLIIPTGLFPAIQVAADTGWYGEIAVGYSKVDVRSEVVHQGTNSPGTPTYNIKPSAVYGGGIGYRLPSGVAFQLDFRRREFDTDDKYLNGSGPNSDQRYSLKSTTQSDAFVINALYFFQGMNAFEPYLKGGIGYGRNTFSGKLDIRPRFDTFGPGRWDYPEETINNFIWQLGAGGSVRISPHFRLAAELQYVDLGKAHSKWDRFGDRGHVKNYSSVEITAALQYWF